MTEIYPETPDGRYFVVRARLWRKSDPALSQSERKDFVAQLMRARRAVASAKRAKNSDAEAKAREAVDAAKQALGERGPVWWSDETPDLTRHLVHTTPYADWFRRMSAAQST